MAWLPELCCTSLIGWVKWTSFLSCAARLWSGTVIGYLSCTVIGYLSCAVIGYLSCAVIGYLIGAVIGYLRCAVIDWVRWLPEPCCDWSSELDRLPELCCDWFSEMVTWAVLHVCDLVLHLVRRGDVLPGGEEHAFVHLTVFHEQHVHRNHRTQVEHIHIVLDRHLSIKINSPVNQNQFTCQSKSIHLSIKINPPFNQNQSTCH